MSNDRKHKIILSPLTTFGCCIFHPSPLHVFFQLHEEDAEGVDNTEDDSIDEEAAEEDEPGPAASVWLLRLVLLLTGGGRTVSHQRRVCLALHVSPASPQSSHIGLYLKREWRW